MHIVYTKEHIMQAIGSIYMIAREVDPIAARDLKISPELPIWEWADGMDFIPNWRVHWNDLRYAFSSEIPAERFKALWKDEKAVLGDLASLIAFHSSPVIVPAWKFGGRLCIQGSILKFLLKRINRETLPPDSTVVPGSSLGSLAKRKNWSFVLALSSAFPGCLPVPKKISHRGLLPRRIIAVQKILGLAGIMLLPAFTGAVAVMSEAAVSVLGINILIGAGTLFYLKILRIPETEHFIFPGLGSLRDLAMQISSDFPGHKI